MNRREILLSLPEKLTWTIVDKHSGLIAPRYGRAYAVNAPEAVVRAINLSIEAAYRQGQKDAIQLSR